MGLSISEAIVVITGASSGIARATALEIARQQGTVVVASRQEAALQEVKQECDRLGGHAIGVRTDVTNEEQVRALAAKAIETFGRIDAWVNAAAVTLLGRFDEAPPEAFRRVIETNFFGYVHGSRAVLPHFRERKRGVLINVASVVGKVATPYASAYVASKFAVTGFTESLRMEYRDMPNVHICTVFPATIDTPLFQHAANYSGRAVQAMPPVYTPELVACEIVRCIEKPKREVVVGNTRRLVAMRTFAPALAERMTATKMYHQHFQDQPAEATAGNVFEPMPLCNVRGGWDGYDGLPGKGWIAVAGLAAGLGFAAWYLSQRNRSRHRWINRLSRMRLKRRRTLWQRLVSA